MLPGLVVSDIRDIKFGNIFSNDILRIKAFFKGEYAYELRM